MVDKAAGILAAGVGVLSLVVYFFLVGCTALRMSYDAVRNLDNEKLLAHVCTVARTHDDLQLQVTTFDVAFIGRSCKVEEDVFEVRIPFELSRVTKNARKLQIGEHVKLNGETVNVSDGDEMTGVVFMARSIRD